MVEIEESIWDDYRGQYKIATRVIEQGNQQPVFLRFVVSRISLINKKTSRERETREGKEKREKTSNWWRRSLAAVHLAQSIYITAVNI